MWQERTLAAENNSIKVQGLSTGKNMQQAYDIYKLPAMALDPTEMEFNWESPLIFKPPQISCIIP